MCTKLVVWLVLCSMVCIALEDGLRELLIRIEKQYDEGHAPLKTFPPPPHHHERRCSLMLPHQALSALALGMFKPLTGGQPVLVSSSCLGIESLGNYLSNYLDNVACARKIGIAYMAVAKVYEPRVRDQSNAFLDALPNVVPASSSHSSGGSSTKTTLDLAYLKAACPCPESCHSRKNSLWSTSVASVVAPLLQNALERYRAVLPKNTTVGPDDLGTPKAPPGTILPLIPDVSVHYRCGDNFVGHYGFLPFPVIAGLIPKSARTIYVLAESRSRKARNHLTGTCDAVLKAIHKFLAAKFPLATVLVRRGGDVFADMVRLYDSPVTICSVSTFCLWPVLAGGNHTVAHFPITPLILAASRPELRPGLQWTGVPIRGAPFEFQAPGVLIKALGGG